METPLRIRKTWLVAIIVIALAISLSLAGIIRADTATTTDVVADSNVATSTDQSIPTLTATSSDQGLTSGTESTTSSEEGSAPDLSTQQDIASTTDTTDTNSTSSDSTLLSAVATTSIPVVASTTPVKCDTAYTSDLYDTPSGHLDVGFIEASSTGTSTGVVAHKMGTQSWAVCKDYLGHRYEMKITPTEYNGLSQAGARMPQFIVPMAADTPKQ